MRSLHSLSLWLLLFTLSGAQPLTAQSVSQTQKPWQGNTSIDVDRSIFRIAEVAGSLAFLQDICAATDADKWPLVMQQLLDAEGTSPDRKGRIAGAYNNGYRNYAVTYQSCTASAREASQRYLAEIEQLSSAILKRQSQKNP
ncbi:TIGR02301 family protein [Microvirga sp. W0021]|uniref:TIGR02301 family protein n=1 Tax=Hohaiivirga grylli TaxID=3133970 RepID=A0ABV0BH35_9HYPH